MRTSSLFFIYYLRHFSCVPHVSSHLYLLCLLWQGNPVQQTFGRLNSLPQWWLRQGIGFSTPWSQPKLSVSFPLPFNTDLLLQISSLIIYRSRLMCIYQPTTAPVPHFSSAPLTTAHCCLWQRESMFCLLDNCLLLFMVTRIHVALLHGSVQDSSPISRRYRVDLVRSI